MNSEFITVPLSQEIILREAFLILSTTDLAQCFVFSPTTQEVEGSIPAQYKHLNYLFV
jgi:hypothetical protein